jgi:hypothetical protein
MFTVGLVLCHGKKHDPIPQKYQSLVDRWVYLDISPNVGADIVGSFLDQSVFTRAQIRGGYAVVMEYGCPIYWNWEGNDLETWMDRMTRLVATGGVVIIKNFASRVLYLIEMAKGGHRSGTEWKLINMYKKNDPKAIELVQQKLCEYGRRGHFKSWSINDRQDAVFVS